MRTALAVFLIFAIACESGCSGVESVKCRGVYRYGNEDEAMSTKAVLGFEVERASFLGNLISRTKDWKGFVSLTYDSDPYASSSKSGAEILDIMSDDYDGSVSAGKNEKDRTQLLFYDHVGGLARYYDTQNNIDKSFSGMCHQES